MTDKKKLTCTNCGQEFIPPHKGATPKNEGWLVEAGTLFCCCVCRAEYNKKKTKRK